ncbi:MAG: P-loop NTPase [Pirellulales bacterium]|nr:P-loop NTPase [Pirellulales bacterium]
MTDQATELRRLAAGAQYDAPSCSARRPHVVAVAAGKGGVGTTTVAIGLAAALASEEQTSLLIDGNVNNPDVLATCGVTPQPRHNHYGSAPWGPAGMHIATELPSDSAWLNQTLHESSADIAIVDAGSGLNRTVRDLWHAADQVVLVTGQDPIAAMDAYAAVKLMATDARQPVSTLINHATSEAIADEIHQRIAHACQRFLGRTLVAGGYVPTEPSLARGQGVDLLDSFRNGQAMLGFRRLAQQVARNASTIRNSRPMTTAAA